MEANVYTVCANCQLVLDGIQIGVGNVRQEQYVDEAGASHEGMTASLSIVTAGATTAQRQRVHAGQVLAVDGYRIEVLAVDGEQGGAVRLDVRPDAP